MGNSTTVIDALGNATYYTWSGEDITSVTDALGRQTILGRWDPKTDPCVYAPGPARGF